MNSKERRRLKRNARNADHDLAIEEMCRQTDDQSVATKEMVAIGLQPTCGAAISLTSRLTVLEELNERW